MYVFLINREEIYYLFIFENISLIIVTKSIHVFLSTKKRKKGYFKRIILLSIVLIEIFMLLNCIRFYLAQLRITQLR